MRGIGLQSLQRKHLFMQLNGTSVKTVTACDSQSIFIEQSKYSKVGQHLPPIGFISKFLKWKLKHQIKATPRLAHSRVPLECVSLWKTPVRFHTDLKPAQTKQKCFPVVVLYSSSKHTVILSEDCNWKL